jgi:hypothetical protein
MFKLLSIFEYLNHASSQAKQLTKHDPLKMPHQIPANINLKLTPFVYRSTRTTTQPTTKTVERTVLGAITGFTDPNSGVVTINQQSYTVSEQVYAGNVYFYFATFDGPNGSTIEFQVVDGYWLAVGTVLYIGIEKEFWVFQYENMPTPHLIIETPPGGEKWVWLPGPNKGTDLQSPKAQMDMRAGTFPLRNYLDKIGKNTPRSLLSSSRLEDIMSKTKSEVALSYSAAHWPRRKDTLPKDASAFERIFWPILKYKPTKTIEDFGISQKVSGEINKTWVGGSLIVGTLVAYLVDGIFLQQTLRALGLNPYFFMHTITGLFLLGMFFTVCSLAVLLVFMKPAIKRPFKFDEESFFKILNTAYHNQANLGFCCLDYVSTHTKGELNLISDDQVKSNLLWSAHQRCTFIYKSYSDLINKLEETKLTAEERATLLDQITAQPPSF